MAMNAPRTQKSRPANLARLHFRSDQRPEAKAAIRIRTTATTISAIPTGLTLASETPPEKTLSSHSDIRSAPFHRGAFLSECKKRGATPQRADCSAVPPYSPDKYSAEPLYALRGAPRQATPFTCPTPKRPSSLCASDSLSAGEPSSLGSRLRLLLFIIVDWIIA